MNKTKAAVVGFLIGLVVLFSCEDSNAETRVVAGIGKGVMASSEHVSQVLGATYADRWGLEYSRVGDQDSTAVDAISVYRRVYANKGNKARFFMELGAAYFDRKLRKASGESNLVDENLTYHLSLGGSYELSKRTRIVLKLKHNSVAGRVEDNTGIDHVELTFNWKI